MLKSLLINYPQNKLTIWGPSSLCEPTPSISNMELSHLGSEASI